MGMQKQKRKGERNRVEGVGGWVEGAEKHSGNNDEARAEVDEKEASRKTTSVQKQGPAILDTMP